MFQSTGAQTLAYLYLAYYQGAGKGTQSTLMEENYPVAHFSVGELLRNVPESSPHKTTIEASLVAGQIVPVEISLALLKASMEASAKHNKQTLFLVDGFPRNFDNLSGWCRIMGDAAVLESVLVYQCPLAVLRERILQRAKDSGRADDNLESVKKRFGTFESETVPVVDTLRSLARDSPIEHRRWSVADIAGDRPLQDVWKSTQQVLNELIVSDILTANSALLDAIQMGDTKAYESLCDANFFIGQDTVAVMSQQEGVVTNLRSSRVEQAQVDVISGKQVAVSYNCVLDGELILEKRFWTHQGPAGWRNVHFARTPATHH
jgi:UMP-CMP kinase